MSMEHEASACSGRGSTVVSAFKDTTAYRAEAEITAQVAMTMRLALKLGYLWRYSYAPIAGFR